MAPVYLDSELGITDALGPHTDVGLGLAGGGFADSYFDFQNGQYLRGQSFYGHSAETSVSDLPPVQPRPAQHSIERNFSHQGALLRLREK